MIEDAQIVRRTLGQRRVLHVGPSLLQAQQVIGAVEQAGLGGRGDGRSAAFDLDSERAFMPALHFLVDAECDFPALPTLVEFGTGDVERIICRRG